MIRRGAILATGLGAVVIGVAGCGGGGGGAAVGTTSGGVTATAGATTTSRGGVLGAQANVDRAKLRAQANRIEQMLNRQVEQLRGSTSRQDLAATATTIHTQLLKAANRLDRLDLQSRQAQQQRAHLESALRSLAADVTTLKGDAQSGNLSKAMNDVTNLSSLIAVRQSIQAIRQNGSQRDGQALRNQASTIAGTLQMRLLKLAGTKDAQTFAKRLDQLRSFLQRHEQRVKSMNVPQAQQDEKQALVGFLDNWESTLDAAHDQAANGNLNAAKQKLAGGSLSDIEGLVTSLTASG